MPIYPVVIGPKDALSDLAIIHVKAATKVSATLRKRCKSTKAVNLPPQELMVEMHFHGKDVKQEHRRVIAHDGKDDVYTIRFQAKMDEIGTHTLRIKATSKEGKEITLANNEAAHILRVADDKAKVLIIDGEARWEYHYLAAALVRDPAIALDRVVFSQPRIGALKDAELEKAGLPKSKLPDAKERDPLFDYDCILLGDVSPEERRLRIAADWKICAERGGTLVMIAGKRFCPMAYAALADEPFARCFPSSRQLSRKTQALRCSRPMRASRSRSCSSNRAPVFSWPVAQAFLGRRRQTQAGGDGVARAVFAPAPSFRPLSQGEEKYICAEFWPRRLVCRHRLHVAGDFASATRIIIASGARSWLGAAKAVAGGQSSRSLWIARPVYARTRSKSPHASMQRCRRLTAMRR